MSNHSKDEDDEHERTIPSAPMRSPDIFRPRYSDHASAIPSIQRQKSTTIAQDIESLLQFLDDFTFPSSVEHKTERNTSPSSSPRSSLQPGRILDLQFQDKVPSADPINIPETTATPIADASKCNPPISVSSSSHASDHSYIMKEVEEKERHAKLYQWVEDIRAAVSDAVHEYRHYISLLQEQSTRTAQEYQQTVAALQDVIQQQAETIRALQQHQQQQQQQQMIPSQKPSELTSIRMTLESSPRRVSPAQDTSRTPISPSLSSSNKENRSIQISPPQRNTIPATKTMVQWIPEHQCRRIQFPNGTVQEIYYTANKKPHYDIIRFINGDIKMTAGGEIYYYYAASGIIQRTTKSNHTAIITKEYHYPNGQVEYHSPDSIVVQFPNGRVHQSRRPILQPAANHQPRRATPSLHG